MKQEEIDNMMNEIDKKCKLPKHWSEFINKQTQKFNYIIKDIKEKECYCTSCQYTFYDTKVRVVNYYTCPNCKKDFYVVSQNNQYIKSFKKSVNLVQRINKNIITRVFEIETFYNKDTKMMENDIEEYCRIIPGKGKFLSDAVWFFLGYMSIYHYGEGNKGWREYKGCRYFGDFETYPFNQKQMIKGTKFQYAPIQEFTKKFWRYNFIDAIELAGYESFELLWNMKLYNLCFSAKKLNKNGSFYKRFGLSKDYLKFMQDNDIDYRELRLLKLSKKKDYSLIEKCYNKSYKDVKFLYENGILEDFLESGNTVYLGNIKILKEINEFIPLRKLKDYPKGIKNLNIYRDYLVMSKKLALNYKSKKDLFPRNLIARHDKMQKKIKVDENIKTNFGTYLRFLELSKYIYEDENYIIFPAPSTDDLKEEGRQQGNCVGYMYLNPYIEGKTEIFFIRKLDNITKSFITLEFKDGQVQQKELPHHSRAFTKEQENFIQKWEGYRQFIDKKEKYSKKNKTVVKYELKKLVA